MGITIAIIGIIIFGLMVVAVYFKEEQIAKFGEYTVMKTMDGYYTVLQPIGKAMSFKSEETALRAAEDSYYVDLADELTVKTLELNEYFESRRVERARRMRVATIRKKKREGIKVVPTTKKMKVLTWVKLPLNQQVVPKRNVGDEDETIMIRR